MINETKTCEKCGGKITFRETTNEGCSVAQDRVQVDWFECEDCGAKDWE